MKLIKKLRKVQILTIKSLFALLGSLMRNGMNLMTLTGYCSKIYSHKIALSFGDERYSYSELYRQSRQMSNIFETKFKIAHGNRVGILCRNNTFAIKTIFAVSGIGANIYFLNADMAARQLEEIVEELKLNFVIYDFQKLDISRERLLSREEIEYFSNIYPLDLKEERKGKRNGEIVVLSGGTGGRPKMARRKASLKDYANPFFALLREMDLDKFSSIYIAPPIFHGLGLSSLIVAFLLGSEVFISGKYDTKNSLELIAENNIEVVSLVPVMLRRMLDSDVSKLKSLKRIISGGAPLSATLIKETFFKLGKVLYNLYGSSEAGFSVMANPEILEKYPLSVGKPIRGVKLRILSSDKKILPVEEIGEIYIKTSWSMSNKREKWVNTGDLGFLDKFGNLFLKGRNDEMIVSGGENVFTFALENSLLEHKYIKEVAVIGIEDAEFGQRLKAFVVKEDNKKLSETDITDWLKNRVARYEMPVQIEFVNNLKYTQIGKIDKKNMR